MTSLSFQFDEWLQGNDPDPRRALTLASLVIAVDDVPATRLFDSWAQTVTDRARLPLYPLAEWFAANWWRLHHEAPRETIGGPPPLDWRLSHDLAAVGGGYVWPRLRFASDDLTIQVSARALRSAAWEPVRHLNDIPPAGVPVTAFDAAIEQLIGLVLNRLRELDVSAEPLETIWSDVIAERDDAEVAEWRAWEARLGYDPGEAPEQLMQQIASLFMRAGKAALAEIVPVVEHHDVTTLDRILAIADLPGVAATLPLTGRAPSEPGHRSSLTTTPWDAGRAMARQLRRDHGPASGPIGDRQLFDFLGIARDGAKLPKAGGDRPIGLGVRAAQGSSTLHFRRRSPHALRFEAARFIAESMTAPEADRLLPLTDLATARQKFQRAFAAELLAPIDEIVELVGPSPSTDSVEYAGSTYQVSPLAIANHLENYHRIQVESSAS